MSVLPKIIIVGATSAIAEHCARLWLEASAVELVLLGRSEERLERLANDLRVRSPTSMVSTLSGDFSQTAAIRLLVEQSWDSQAADIVLIVHGFLPEQAHCQSHMEDCRTALEVNAVSPALFAEAFAEKMTDAEKGKLAIMGSVAGDRGRQSNYIYGAAKGLLERYAQGLQHRFAGSAVKVVLIKPGPTDTPMTAKLKQSGLSLAPVKTVAQQILRAIDRGVPVAYVPGKWWLIMMVIRHLPRFVFNRMRI